MIEISLLILAIIGINSSFFHWRSNPTVLYTFWWVFWLVLSYLNLINLYEVSEYLYLLIILSIGLSNVSFLLSFGSKLKLLNLKELRNKKELNKYLIIYSKLFVVATLLLIIRMLFIIDFDITEYWKARYYYFGIPLPGSDTTSVISLFPSSILAGLYHISTSVLMFCFIVSLAFDSKKLFHWVLFAVLSWCILSTGRDIILYVLAYIIFLLKNNEVMKNKISLIFLVTIIVLLSLFRNDGLQLVLYGFISYFTGAIVYLDQLILADSNNVMGNGGIILSQIFPIFYHLANAFEGTVNNRPYLELGISLTEFVRISDASLFYNYYNAIPTWFYFFYKDFGYLGIVLIPCGIFFLLGLLYKCLSTDLIEHKALMSYIEACLLWSIFKPQLLDPQFLFVLITLVLLMVKNERSNFNNGL